MSLLTVMQAVADELALSPITSVIGNADKTVKQLLALANHEGKQMRKAYAWPQLTIEGTITLNNGVAGYPLPNNFDRMISQTHWDTTNKWRVFGPCTAQEWAAMQYSGFGSLAYKSFRAKGVTAQPDGANDYTGKQIYIYPTPTAADAGTTIKYEYISRSCFVPQVWVSAGAKDPASHWCYSVGGLGYYYGGTGSSFGTTEPTWTDNAYHSDGVNFWILIDATYDTCTSDKDSSAVSDHLWKLGIKWRFLQRQGLDYQLDFAEYDAELRSLFVSLNGSRKMFLGGGIYDDLHLIDHHNIPDTGIS
jgi:hypothetical protein